MRRTARPLTRRVKSIEPVYLPQIRHTIDLREYTYPYEYFAAGPSRVTSEDGIHRCVHCDAAGTDDDTYCANCGSINCDSHIRTEHLEGTPVCTGCAVTERFAFKTKYSYDAENRDAFREEYEAMPFYEKAIENTLLAVGTVVLVGLVLLGVLASLGGV